MSSNAQRYPPLVGIIKLQGGLVLQDDTFIQQDLWFDSGLKGTITDHPDEGILYHAEGYAQIIDAQSRFWDAVRIKDYSAHMVFDISGLLAVPGFIDIQTNGAFGLDYTTPPEFDKHGNIKPTALQHIIEAHDVDDVSEESAESFHPNLNTIEDIDMHQSPPSTHFPSSFQPEQDVAPSTPRKPSKTVNATSSLQLQPKPNVKRVELNTVNKVNPIKWAISSTKPIEMSTTLSRSSSTSSRYTSPSHSAFTSPNHSKQQIPRPFTPSFHHLPTISSPPSTPQIDHPNNNPFFNSTGSTTTSPDQSQVVAVNQSTSSQPSLQFCAGEALSNICSTPAISLESNFLPYTPQLDTITSLPFPPFSIDAFQGAEHLPHIVIQQDHVHPHKARTFLNAFASHTTQTPVIRPITLPTDASSDLLLEADENNNHSPLLLPILSARPSQIDQTTPPDSQTLPSTSPQTYQLVQSANPIAPPQLLQKKSLVSPLPTNPRTSASHLIYPFDINSSLSSLLTSSQNQSLKRLKHLLYTHDPDMLYINERLPQYGVTSICPTIISSDGPTFQSTGERVAAYMLAVEHARRRGLIVRQCNLLGIHLEGPFISVSGAHNKAVLGPPKTFQHASNIYHGNVLFPFTSIVTLAPEMEGALDVTEVLTNQGICVSMGHSQATMNDCKRGIERGACLVTHMFNAMRSFHHRDPGLIGVLGATEPYNIHFSIISDGFHAHPFSVNIAYSSSPDKVILVTDSMAAMGLPDGQYKLGTQDVTMYNLKAVLTHQPESLAGAVVTLDQCVRNFVDFTKCPPEHAILAATKTPAQLLGLWPRKGSLLAGADADIVLLEPGTLKVVATIINGQLCFVDGDVFPRRLKTVKNAPQQQE